jgi:hypothetical protein
MSEPEIDLYQAHRHFGSSCFDAAFSLAQLVERTPDEEQQMFLSAYASLWHWTQRTDCTSRNLSMGYWLLSRVHSILGDATGSARFADLALYYGQDEEPFYLGYAHEAAARAAALVADMDKAIRHLNEGWKLAAEIENPDQRAMLERDLGTVN